MEAPDKSIIDNLQTAAQMISHLAGQYRVDQRNLHAMGLKWLQKKVKCWYHKTEDQLDKMLDRLLYFGVDPDYDIGAVSGADTVTDLLDKDHGLVYALLEKLIEFRKAAWEIQTDYTPDIYEHAIECFEHQAYKIEREQELIKKLGEPGYIGARLEDE